ncbi:MAG: DegV family protein [Sarcina ventriculi]|uniref:EDD domain protein, DegV family n=1 Tax=Sarcina ventriculi TaxID=1267 RepID=A0ABP2APF6_SARVE|nr:DegV family protein [Sarcina ventriculi]MBU5321939.1 DegV family protein [Sarcina ventriculi]MDY7062558.1 DegV family protein [Sarcina ventriculi]CUN42031.1 EDD domain protein%2C DegV family [Sarcina ventriculi]SPZ50816.1 EDD domain protein, DegV family [Sarcina ventriculi]
MAIKIVTDSTSYIPKKYLEKYDISVVSLNILLKNTNRRETSISNQTFYKEMEEAKEFAVSSQPTPEEFYDVFDKIAKNGDDIVGIFISSEMSGTYSTANLVKNMILEKYDINIEIIDSRTNCMQMGFVVLEAAKHAKFGKSMNEILDITNNTIKNSRFVFSPSVLDYLKKGGRIGSASALIGNLFQIKPILTVNNGKTDVLAKVRTKKKAVSTMIDILMNDLKEKELGGVIVHHINCEEDGLTLAKTLEEKLNMKVDIQDIGPVIGSHVGPGSIGIAYFWK